MEGYVGNVCRAELGLGWRMQKLKSSPFFI